jgi:ribokinase
LLRAGVKQVVMTLGETGALIVTTASAKHVPGHTMRAVDTTGAGDAFNAGLATALAHGDDLESAVQFAVITGAMAVTREGVIPSLPRVDEVIGFCRERNLRCPNWLAARQSQGVLGKR